MATLNMYLTSLEPDMKQTIYSQSIGGYCSNSVLYPETTLVSTIGLYDTSISLNTPASGWLAWQGVEYINIGNEVMQVSSIIDGTVTVVERGYNGIINMHIATDVVGAISAKELFNNVFDENHKQYRCIAVKNDSPSSNVYNFQVYLKNNSRSNDSTVKIALEQPNSQYLSSTSTSWATDRIVDASLVSLYSDNHFRGAYLKIPSLGQGKLVSSFDSSTGTFMFYSSFSSDYDYTTNVSYEVLPSPAQRVKTGVVSPTTGTDDVLSFSSPTEDYPVRFVSGSISVPSVSDLMPDDVFYIWLERTIDSASESFDNNDITLDISYSVSV